MRYHKERQTKPTKNFHTNLYFPSKEIFYVYNVNQDTNYKGDNL